MNTIDGIGGPRAPRAAPRPRAQIGGPPFMAGEPEAAAGSSGAMPAAPVTLASMLALQEVGGETVEDRQARRHGYDLLGMLTELQRGLLGSCDEAPALERLVALLAVVPRATDRRLDSAISAIVVRARVELARRQM